MVPLSLPAVDGPGSTERGLTDTHTRGTGVVPAPRGLSVCTQGPLNHEAEALQLLFAEPSAQ